MNETSRHSGRWPGTAIFRERLREEGVPLHLPPPAPPDRRPETEKKPEGGTRIIIQVWPTPPEPADEDTDRTW